MSERKHTIVLVGHCGPDAHLLAGAARRAVPGANVEMVNDRARLDAVLPTASLLLVNRVLDGDFGGGGLDLIRSLHQGGDGAETNGAAPAAILISNFEEAQREAEAAGACPGFGKRAVMSQEATDRIRSALRLEE